MPQQVLAGKRILNSLARQPDRPAAPPILPAQSGEASNPCSLFPGFVPPVWPVRPKKLYRVIAGDGRSTVVLKPSAH